MHCQCLRLAIKAQGMPLFNGTRFGLPPACPAAVAARMCTFAETRCGGFEASAARGYLHAWLANIGTLPASYTIIVTDCRWAMVLTGWAKGVKTLLGDGEWSQSDCGTGFALLCRQQARLGGVCEQI